MDCRPIPRSEVVVPYTRCSCCRTGFLPGTTIYKTNDYIPLCQKCFAEYDGSAAEILEVIGVNNRNIIHSDIIEIDGVIDGATFCFYTPSRFSVCPSVVSECLPEASNGDRVRVRFYKHYCGKDAHMVVIGEVGSFIGTICRDNKVLSVILLIQHEEIINYFGGSCYLTMEVIE